MFPSTILPTWIILILNWTTSSTDYHDIQTTGVTDIQRMDILSFEAALDELSQEINGDYDEEEEEEEEDDEEEGK